MCLLSCTKLMNYHIIYNSIPVVSNGWEQGDGAEYGVGIGL